MQVIWVYVDELVGKGLEWTVIAELLFYFSASLIPQALPLSVLIASIMSFGNLGESYELVAAKAAGISLRTTFKPMLLVMSCICAFAFFVSNILIPQANLKKLSLLYDVRQQKPALAISERVFYNGIEGITMRIGKKDKKTQEMHDIYIYDQRDNKQFPVIITAKHGNMSMSEDKRILFFNLFDGERYEELERTQGYYQNHQHLRGTFQQERVAFDMSNFLFNRTDESLFKHHYEMQNIVELMHNTDSLDSVTYAKVATIRNMVKPYCKWEAEPDDSSRIAHADSSIVAGDTNMYAPVYGTDTYQTISSALNDIRSVKNMMEYTAGEMNELVRQKARHVIEWHRKFILTTACLVMFFIGAPLGSIIRKGGFGLPIVISILLYVAFHIIALSGEKASKTLVWTPAEGMWLPIWVMLPLGVFLTIQASNDAPVFDKTVWVGFFKKWFTKKPSKA